MTARVLVVDDVAANVQILQIMLEAEYYDVITADCGRYALERAACDAPDIILLDVMMPDLDGFETCRRLKADPITRHIPVVMVTALDQREDRIKGLQAGADDFLTKPVDDIALFSRIKALTRYKAVVDELIARQRGGADAELFGRIEEAGENGCILVIDDLGQPARDTAAMLGHRHRTVLFGDEEAERRVREGSLDLIVANINAQSFDGLRLCAHLRSGKMTRDLPLLALVDKADKERQHRALELGVNDIVVQPVDPQELAARARTQLRRKRYLDMLRNTLDQSVELAVKDPLTGLNNRRVMESQLEGLTRRAALGGRPVSVAILDLDHFKRINDTFGHHGGDEVLKEFARRLTSQVRAVDICCRFGGEEFVVVMPDTDMRAARMVSERIRKAVGDYPFVVGPNDQTTQVTVSIGVAVSEGENETGVTLLKRADDMVYKAKNGGRNRVEASEPVMGDDPAPLRIVGGAGRG